MEEETAIVKTRKIGGSLVVTIPIEIAKIKQLEENQLVEIKIKKKKIDGFGILKGIGSFTRKDRMEDRV